MRAKSFIFIKSLICLGLFIAFSKIYQQNKAIKLQYDKQRLEVKKIEKSKQYNNLLISYSQNKNFRDLQQKAESKYGMQKLQLSKLITFTGECL